MTEIQIPEEIKVGGHTYKIEWVKNLVRDEGNRGCVCWQKHIIELDDNLEQPNYTVTFLHEIIHCIDRHYLSDHINEDETSTIAEGLFQVLSEMGVKLIR